MDVILKVLLVSFCYLPLVMSLDFASYLAGFKVKQNITSNCLICSACPGSSEGVLWPETNAVQFPELSATTTCSFYQGHLRKGNFLSGVFIYIYDNADKGAKLWTGTKVAF